MDKYIPIVLSLASLALFLAGSALIIFAHNLLLGFTLMMLSVVAALAGLFNGLFQIAKKKSARLVNVGAILSGLECCLFAYVVLSMAFNA
jgi:hypothetical protein